MNILETFISTTKKTFNITDRTTRAEFWNFHLVSMFIQFSMIALYALSLNFGFNHLIEILFVFYVFYMLIASFTLGARRLNDLNKNKWLMLVSFIPFIGVLFYYVYLGFAKGYENTNNTEEKHKTELKDGFVEIK